MNIYCMMITLRGREPCVKAHVCCFASGHSGNTMSMVFKTVRASHASSCSGCSEPVHPV